MSIGLVVARYNEDLTWLEKFQDKNVYIYNKGNDEIQDSWTLMFQKQGFTTEQVQDKII